MKNDGTKKLWVSENKDWVIMFLFFAFFVHGMWLFTVDGFTWVNLVYTAFMLLGSYLKGQTHYRLTKLENEVNFQLEIMGFVQKLPGVVVLVNGASPFEGIVWEMKTYPKKGRDNDYSVALSKVDGSVTFYHYQFLGLQTKWVAVVCGSDVKVFTNSR